MQDGVCVERHEGTPQGGPLSPLLGQSAAGRSGQGTGTPRPPLLPLRRRLQHLRAVAGGGRAGDGVGDRSSWKGNCSCASTGRRARWPRSRNASSWATGSSSDGTLGDRSQESGPGQGRDPGDHPPQPRRSAWSAVIAGTQLVPDGLGDVLPLCGRARAHLQRLDEWIRRKLRCVRLKQRKRAKPIADFLQQPGRARMARLAAGAVGQRLVAHGRTVPQAAEGHDHRLVQGSRARQPRPTGTLALQHRRNRRIR